MLDYVRKSTKKITRKYNILKRNSFSLKRHKFKNILVVIIKIESKIILQFLLNEARF